MGRSVDGRFATCYPLAIAMGIRAILRRFSVCVALAAVLPLGGCGFAPLYGRTASGASAVDELAAIQVEAIPDRSGQILRNSLRDALNPNGLALPARYRLRIRMIEPRQELALQRNDTVARVGYGVVATYYLVDAAGRTLISGNASLNTNFEVSDSQYATLASRNSARDRVMAQISEDIRDQLAIYLGSRPPQASVLPAPAPQR